MFANTSKHFQTVTTVGEEPARYLIEMAAAVAGGARELRERLLVSFVECTAGPLSHDTPNLEAALVAAEHGVPAGFLPLPLAAATAPATLAGTLVVTLAEALSGIVLLRLARPGVSCFIATAPSVIDLTSGGYTGGGPEDYVLAAAATQLAHSYGLPIAMGTMATGAKEPGWQAAVDDSLSTLAGVMSWADLMNGCGLLGGSRTLSYPHMVMETEVFGIVKKMAAGVVDDDTLALDAIAEVGPDGTYLGHKHTRRHAAAIRRPGIWDRTPHEVWQREGSRGAYEPAREIADGILADHRPEPLSDDVAAALRALVDRADRESVDA